MTVFVVFAGKNLLGIFNSETTAVASIKLTNAHRECMSISAGGRYLVYRDVDTIYSFHIEQWNVDSLVKFL